MRGVRHDDPPPVIVFGFARMERDGPVEQINLIDSKVQQFRDSPAEGVTSGIWWGARGVCEGELRLF